MFYSFPNDLHLDEVRAVVAAHNEATGTKAFIESDRGDHVVFNYVISFDGSFPEPKTGDASRDRFNAILRECRGLTLDKDTGRVVARKFQKFFNVNEKPETQMGLIDWSRPHLVLEKLDGSMITPYLRFDGEIEWHTKMGATDVARPVNAFVSENPLYTKFAHYWMSEGYTPIFEWCSRKQKIVIDYPEDRLILTAIRRNACGSYVPHSIMAGDAGGYGIPVVKALPGNVDNIHEFMAQARDVEGAEGYVIRFQDGHMVKVKGEWYCRIHKTKELLQFEKDVWALVLDEKLDDAKGFMDEADRERVERFESELNQRLLAKASVLAETVEAKRAAFGNDKKQFAVEFASKADPMERPLLFSMWDGHKPLDVVKNHVAKFTGSGSKIEIVRPLVDGLTWDDFRDRSLRLDD